MATTFYPRSSSSDVTPPAGYTYRELLLTRGAAAADTGNDTTSAGVASGTAITEWWDQNDVNVPFYRFVSKPLDAVTITGSITLNIRALESNAMANYGVGAKFYKRSTLGTVTLLGASGLIGAELGTAEAARNGSFSPGSWSIGAGERLIVELWWYAAGGTSASGYTVKGFFNGPTAAASGDTYVTFTETIAEAASNPAPNALALTLAAVAPRIDQQASPGALALAIAAVAPSIVFTVNPAALALAAAPVAPSRIDQTAPIGAAARTLTPVAPRVDQAVTPAAIAQALAAVAPSRIDQAVNPAALARALVPVAPRIDQQAVMGILALSAAGIAPRIDQAVAPSALALALAAVAPRIDQAVQMAAVALALGVVAPSSIDVAGVGGQNVSPGALALTAAALAPRIDQVVAPALVALILDEIPPALETEVRVAAAVALTAAALSPRIDQAVALAELALSLTPLPTSAITYPQNVSPAALALVLAQLAPRVDQQVSPAAAARTLTAISPTAMHFALDLINIALSLGVPAPTVSGGVQAPTVSGADPWFRRQQGPSPTPIEAWSLYTNLVARYGLAEGRQIYERMRNERKGPFQSGAKYDPDRGSPKAIPHVEIPRARKN